MQVCSSTLPPSKAKLTSTSFHVRVGQHSLAIFQATNPLTFDKELEQWLSSCLLIGLALTVTLLPPNHFLRFSDDGYNEIRIQRDLFLASSGTISTTLDAVRLSMRAPPFLFFSAQQPMVSIWIPISDWGTIRTWPVIEALQHAARSLLRPYDPAETLSGQILAKIFVGLTLSSAACTHINYR